MAAGVVAGEAGAFENRDEVLPREIGSLYEQAVYEDFAARYNREFDMDLKITAVTVDSGISFTMTVAGVEGISVLVRASLPLEDESQVISYEDFKDLVLDPLRTVT